MKGITLEQATEIMNSKERVRVGRRGINSFTGKIKAVQSDAFLFERSIDGAALEWYDFKDVEVWNWRDRK